MKPLHVFDALLVIAMICIFTDQNPIAWLDRDPQAARKDAAYERAQKCVLERLKCPSTAHFCPLHDITEPLRVCVSEKGALVESWVDAQNGFGAPIRVGWRALFNEYGGLVTLELKDTSIANPAADR